MTDPLPPLPWLQEILSERWVSIRASDLVRLRQNFDAMMAIVECLVCDLEDADQQIVDALPFPEPSTGTVSAGAVPTNPYRN